MHVAMLSRKCELEYLRRLVESLYPYILPPQAAKSQYVLYSSIPFVLLHVYDVN